METTILEPTLIKTEGRSNPNADLAWAMLKNYEGSTDATLQLLPIVQSTARIANTNIANDSLTTTTTVLDIVGKTMLFSMFPNPATDVVYISINGNSECTYTISITDVYGKTIGANVPLAEGGKLNYSTNALHNGLYYVQLHCNNVIIGEQKLIINK